MERIRLDWLAVQGKAVGLNDWQLPLRRTTSVFHIYFLNCQQRKLSIKENIVICFNN